jgi:putative spermidine/putrescine transport system substrate-binding protein
MMKERILLIMVFVALPVAAAARGSDEQVSEGQSVFESTYRSLEWNEVVEQARGSDLYWYMWGGSDSINRFVQGYLTDRLADEYSIRLVMVPVTDASVFVSKVLGEARAGRTTDGSVDLVWINGENFRSMRESDLLFGPYADLLPNITYVDQEDPTVANDFGFPVDAYESPYGSAQMVMIYDSGRIEPPMSIGQLIEWIRHNPGRFTYPASPDFTGSAFVRHVFYHVAAGYERLLGGFDRGIFDEVAEETWTLLNELEPYLWREGRTYPESGTQLQQLFANREVDFDMSYNPGSAANLVSQGRYPETTRTFVFDEGTIGNTHFVAIPFNSPHKPAAMVLANLLLDPAAQLEKARAEVWGDMPVVQMTRIPGRWQEAFDALPRPESVLPAATLQTHRLPELQSTWLEAIEAGWIANVLQQ